MDFLKNYFSLYFVIILIVFQFLLNIFKKYYALDKPDFRKKHAKEIPQLGGLIFSSLFLLICYAINLVPFWFIIGGIISILLGAYDDNYDIKWYFKLFVQIGLIAFIAIQFWGEINSIIFFNNEIILDQFLLLALFSIWFVGIYNAVNLIDGLDGLASGWLFYR